VLPAAARAVSGTVYTVGDNREGELGNATDNTGEVAHPTPFPVALFGAPGVVVQISAGAHSSFAVTSFGQLYGWGENYYGQLGSATNNGVAVFEFPAPNPNPSQILLPGSIGDVVQVAGGRFHTLALTASGQVFSFGNNSSGQLGIADNSGTQNPSPTPKLVTLPGATGPAAEVAAGERASLVVTTTGQLYAFGSNASGQLGTFTNSGTGNPTPTPTLISLPGATGPVIQASSGRNHSMAVTSTGQLYTFGSNSDGQLGRSLNFGTGNPNPLPEEVSLPGATGPVVWASAGYAHGLAVTSTGQLYSFGENFYGQLGIPASAGTFKDIPVPQLVSLPGASGPVVRASAATYNSYVVTSTGQLFGFGSNRWGQLATSTGLGTLTNPTPTLMSFGGGAPVGDVAAGDEHALVLTGEPPDSGGSPPGGDAAPPQTEASAGPAKEQFVPRLLGLKPPQANVSLEGRLVGGKCVPMTAANRQKPSCRRRLELPLHLKLDTDATVTVELDRLTPGRLVRGRCVKPTDANRKGPSCSRASAVGKPTVERLQAGAETLTLTGPALAPGHYEVTVTPYAGGQEGDFETTRFTVTG